MGVTFVVDDVIPAAEPPKTTTLRERYAKTKGVVSAGGVDRRVLAGVLDDGLLAAVHQAFADHRPLVLTPDAIWLTIVRGVAQHVRTHSETLRSRLVRHEATRVIEIESNRFAPDDAAWIAELLGSFRGALAKEVGEGPTRMYVCDFTTSTDLERMASEILLLDVYSPYVFYRAGIVCGIPEITVEGTPDDWRSIRARIDVIEELDLAFWTCHLKRIVDQLVCAAEGRPDRAFFQRIYKPQDNCGDDLIMGWVGWMYPYLGRYADEPNPLLQYDIDATLPGARDERGDWQGPYITAGQVSAMTGTCDVVVSDRATGERTQLHFEASVGAVEVLEGGALRPAAIWSAHQDRSRRGKMIERNARVHALIDRIVAAYPTTPGDPPMDTRGRVLPPDDVLSVLYARLGTAVMGDVQLLPYDQEKKIAVDITYRETQTRFDLHPVFSMADGSVVARVLDSWARISPPLPVFERVEAFYIQGGYVDEQSFFPNGSEVPLVAHSLEELLDWILAPKSELPILGTVQSLFDKASG